VEDPSDRDRLRFGLTGEAGLNDGTAFPFVCSGLGPARGCTRWARGVALVASIVSWAVIGGLGIGYGCGRSWADSCCICGAQHRERSGSTSS
jgi:NhaP-type Na+/H+ or K+/H+ antiporter